MRRLFEATADIRIAIAFAAFPLAAFGPFASFTPGVGGAPYFYRILILLAAPIAVATTLRHWRSRRVASVVFGSGLLVAWSTLSLYWSPSPSAGLRETIGMGISVAGMAVVLLIVVEHPRGFVALTWGAVTASAATLVVATWEKLTGEHLYKELTFGNQTEVMATFYNPNNYSSFLVVTLGAIVFLAVTSKVRIVTVVLTVHAVVVALLIVDIGSRASLAAMVLVLLAAMALPRVPTRLLSRRIVVRFAMLATALAILLGLVYSAAGSEGGEVAQSDRMRVDLGLRALRYTWESWGRGLGAGGFESTLASDPDPASKVTNLHNVYLEILSQLGVVGVGAFLLVLGGVCAPILRGRVSTKLWQLGMAAAVSVALLIGGVTTSSMLAEPSWWLGWALVGGALWSRDLQCPADATRVEETPGNGQ